MKALTLTQPWASLVAVGAKRIETRSWSTSYRGLLLIHAAKGMPREALEACYDDPIWEALHEADVVPFTWLYRSELKAAFPLGAIVGVCDLRDCISTTRAVGALSAARDERERSFGNFDRDRFAWYLRNVQRLPEPIPCRGALGLWTPPDEVLEQVRAQLGEVVVA